MKHYIYLAGPITGLNYSETTDWRNNISKQLNSNKIHCLSPMRGKTFLLNEKSINHSYTNVISNTKGINRRDMFDATRSTCLFVNLLNTQKVSIGTVMEIAWAYQKQIPVIVIMEKDNIHYHPMLEDSSSYIVNTLDEGIILIKYLIDDILE